MTEEMTHFHLADRQSRALKISLLIAVVFMAAEIIGGLIANSLALISDALHLFTDVGAFIVGILALRITKRKSTLKMSYGYHRAEILGALASALSLWALSFVLIYNAIHRLIFPVAVHGPVVFVIASLGLLANLSMMRVLHSSHQEGVSTKVAYLHALSDLLGSIGVIVSGVILWMTQWNPIDPLVTILFSLLILKSSGKVIIQTIRILMEAAPEGMDPLLIQKDLLEIDEVLEVHDLHIWSISATKAALSVHIVSSSPSLTLKQAHQLIEEKYHIKHMTIQMEDPAHFESHYCYDCHPSS